MTTWPLRYWLISRLAGRHHATLITVTDARTLTAQGTSNTLLAIRR